MKYLSFNLLGLCFVLAGVVKVCEICSIEFFKIKSTDLLVVFGAIFLAYICWTISRLIPLLIEYFEIQENVASMAIRNNYFGSE
jgi:hypothetical protein